MARLDERGVVPERHQRIAPVEENRSQHQRYASGVARKILWGSLALAPVTIAADFLLDLGDVALFVLAALALVPLAWLIGEATDHAAHHTGPGIGGFLNATFGNAPELIISLLAIDKGLTEVVRGSLTGSVVGNILLVLGFSLLFGTGDTRLDRESSFVWLALILVATLAFLVPAVPSWHGDPNRHALAVLSVPIAIFLLVLYVGVTWWQLRRHRARHVEAEDDEGVWTLRASVAVLAVATAVTALIAEILVDSIETFADRAHLSDFFVAAVIVAIVGNAAEHGGAVVVAHRGKVKLAAEIALSSGAQVAVFLIPAVALLSWAIEPLALSFRQVELVALGGSALIVGVLVADRRSSRRDGAVLILLYGVVAAAFFVVGDRG
jgi:Ca2+:H+ antiporter